MLLAALDHAQYCSSCLLNNITLACLQEKLFHKIEDDFGLDPHGIEVGVCIHPGSSLVESLNTDWQ